MIRTTDVPDTSNTVVTVIIQKTLVVSWVPSHNSGEALDHYQMEILNLADEYVEDSTCTGSIDNGSSCVFNHDYLMETYGYPVGHILQARVRSRNQNGWGAFS